MLWIAVKRIARSGFINFWRNGFVSLSSILVMTVTLFVIGLLLFIGVVLNTSLLQLKEKVDINVYFVTTANEESVLGLKGDIEALPEVATVEYISREQALAEFKSRHENDELTLQALDELGDNPLGAVLNIKAKETSQYEGIAKFLENKNAVAKDGKSAISKINYFQNKSAIDSLTNIIDSSQTIGLTVIVILAIISLLITFNTIRLVIYTAREEISVMRLVGASAMQVRGPFVVTGMMYGGIAALVTLIIFYPLTYWLGPATANFFGGINLASYYLANFFQIFLIIAGAGLFLGIASSFLAVRRYLST